jgi:putative MATE family efflux protein
VDQHAGILRSILRLAWPGVVLVAFQSAVSIADTHFVGRLGTAPLAGLALVFPLVMLMQMMTAGAMGGGVASAIARALGARDHARAEALLAHAMLLAVVLGIAFALVIVGIGPFLYPLLGGRDDALQLAIVYSTVLFAGAPFVWLANFCAAALRGMGNTIIPAGVLSVTAILHIGLSAVLTLGIGAYPGFGIMGTALAYILGFAVAAAIFLLVLNFARLPVRLRLRGIAWSWSHCAAILRVGAMSSLSALQTVITAVVLTGYVGAFGTAAIAGYGVGVRLELLQVPLVFAVGAALVPLVGMNIGAGRPDRAKRIAWTGAGLAALICALIGGGAALFPHAWITLFSTESAVIAAGESYLRTVGPLYPFIGIGVALYFASQGVGLVGWPVLAGTVRLAIALGGGWIVLALGGELHALFVMIAIGIIAWGAVTAIAVARTNWGK